MFEKFLDKEFLVLSLISKHIKCCLNISKVDTDTMFIKSLSNQLRDISRGVLQPVNWYGIPNSYPKLVKTKNLRVILNEFYPITMFNKIDKYIIITFFIVNIGYPCHLYMLITDSCSSEFTIISFWAPD